MSIYKTILPIGIIVCLVGGSVIIVNELSKPSVKGVSTIISPTSTPNPTSFLTPAATATPTDKPLSKKSQPTAVKEYGGWYWREDLNRAQVWIGTDSAGKDIWKDDFPTPTPTPTPKTAIQQSSTYGTASNTSGTSSIGNMTQGVKESEQKISEKK